MNCIEDELRLRIKQDLESARTKRKNKPVNIKNGHAVITFVRGQEYFQTLFSILENNPNFQTIGYLVRCIVENKDLLSCDTCGKELTYDQSFKASGNFGHHCSYSCAQNSPMLKKQIQAKLSAYYFENYGVVNCMQLSATVAKSKRTFFERYGVDNNMKSKAGMNEYKKSMREKYGVDYTWQISSVQEKRLSTCIQNLGVAFPLQSKEIIDQTVKTKYEKNGGKYFSDSARNSIMSSCIEKYGTDNNMKSELGRQEFRQAMLEKYGVEYPVQVLSIHNKIKQTTFEHYGVNYPMQNHSIFLKTRRGYSFDSMSFDSAPELAMFIYLKDNSMNFEYQPNCSFEYKYGGNSHKYFPDFKIDGQLYEIKGNQFLKEDGTWQCPYDHEKDELFEAKRQCCINNGIIILYKKDYVKYLDYVKEKYGKDYLKQFRKKRRGDMRK